MEKELPEFQWTQQSGVFEDPIESAKIFQSQMQVMRYLFRPAKKPYSLVDWHMRRSPADLHLYAGFGLLSPVEYSFFDHQISRWQDEVLENAIPQKEGDDDPFVMIPAKRLHVFLQHLATEDFDRHEHLLLRFEKPIKLIRALNEALYMEGMRQNPKEGESPVDELLCQEVYPGTESDCWVWMNKMAAANSSSPLDMKLKNTSKALKELNDFQLYKAIADIYDYENDPFIVQRLNGELKECNFYDKLPRIFASLNFLMKHGLLDPATLDKAVRMGSDARKKNELQLKRSAVSSFLCDIAQSAPDSLWLSKMVRAFGTYFYEILNKIGHPVLATKRVMVKDKNGKEGYKHIVNVSFSKTKMSANVKASAPIRPNAPRLDR